MENNTHSVMLDRMIGDKNKSLRGTANIYPAKTAQKSREIPPKPTFSFEKFETEGKRTFQVARQPRQRKEREEFFSAGGDVQTSIGVGVWSGLGVGKLSAAAWSNKLEVKFGVDPSG